jgi:hypothetical protein
MYSYMVCFQGSTDWPAKSEAAIREYARRCFELGFPSERPLPLTKQVFSLEESWQARHQLDPNVTMQEVQQSLEHLGFIFWSTEQEAHTHADARIKLCQEIIIEIYGALE